MSTTFSSSTTSLSLNWQTIYLYFRFHQAGYQLYLVGGAVRDLLLGIDLHRVDLDFTTNARPEQVLELLPESFYENQFGTVMITANDLWKLMTGQELEPIIEEKNDSPKLIDLARATKVHSSLQASLTMTQSVVTTTKTLPNIEITTYRTGESYEHSFRRPDSLAWGNSLTEDLQRRDFTINALALELDQTWVRQQLEQYDLSTLRFNRLVRVADTAYQLHDTDQGLSDLQAGVLRAVGDPDQRFQEDALRMLRAVRLSVQLNLPIETGTFQAIRRHSSLLTHISWERIRDELLKMLASEYPAEAIELLDETGLLAHIMPELQDAKGVEQSGHHTTDVWTHSLDALANCPSADPIVRLATLLHDIAKPQTFHRQKNTITFYNHEVIGARTARTIARRLKLSRQDQQRIFTLVRYHMFHYQPHNTDAAIRRFMRQVGLENLDDILDLREGDRLGSGARRTSWRLEEMKDRMIEQLHQPMEVTDLAINGQDLMTEFALQPGPILGEILNYLLERVLDEAELNTRQDLVRLSKQYLASKADPVS